MHAVDEQARPGRTPRLLVVEDEAHLAAGLKMNLELEGYSVEIAATGRAATAAMVRPEGFDVILLDVMLPDMDGFTFCKRLRDAGQYTPVIMLTARASATDRVAGLEAGADDYLAKPFELDELLARVKSQIRRMEWLNTTQGGRAASELSFGPARVNFDTYEITVSGEAKKLTQLEMDLLRYFADHAGKVLSRDELMREVWKLNQGNTRTVDNFVSRLRKHFEADPANPKHFISIRGAGYKFVP
ncbi:MAG: response regulator transcription factor [Bradymonadia bacterium]